MVKSWLFRMLVAAVMSLSVTAMAQAAQEMLQTDWMDLVKGHTDVGSGTQLRELEDDEAPGMQKITLSIPKTYNIDPATIEEVVVVGRMPEKPEPLLDVSYEWVNDYDNDNYGLVIRFSKDSNWPIRLYLYSDTGFTD